MNFIPKIQIECYILRHVTHNSVTPLLQVAPAELEGFLLSHREIQDAAVVGIDDRVSGEIPRAFIVRKDDSQITAIEVQKFMEGKARCSFLTTPFLPGNNRCLQGKQSITERAYSVSSYRLAFGKKYPLNA